MELILSIQTNSILIKTKSKLINHREILFWTQGFSTMTKLAFHQQVKNFLYSIGFLFFGNILSVFLKKVSSFFFFYNFPKIPTFPNKQARGASFALINYTGYRLWAPHFLLTNGAQLAESQRDKRLPQPTRVGRPQ
jgi:hypothetical protein